MVNSYGQEVIDTNNVVAANTYIGYKELFVVNNGKHQLTQHWTTKTFSKLFVCCICIFSIYYWVV